MATTVSQQGDMLNVVEWIRAADYQIQSQYANWNYLWATGSITTTPSQSAYQKAIAEPEGADELPVDFNVLYPNSIKINGVCLLPLTYQEFYSSGLFDSAATGPPTMVTVRPDNSIQFYPTPDAAYTVDFQYYRTPGNLLNPTDVSLIPEQFHWAIIYLAMRFYAEYDAAQELMLRSTEGYNEWIKKLEASQLPGKSWHLMSDMSPCTVVVE